MRDDLSKYIEWASDRDISANELNSFTIKYYLKFYKQINSAMARILKEQTL